MMSMESLKTRLKKSPHSHHGYQCRLRWVGSPSQDHVGFHHGHRSINLILFGGPSFSHPRDRY
jgi:hypothetical protein